MKIALWRKLVLVSCQFDSELSTKEWMDSLDSLFSLHTLHSRKLYFSSKCVLYTIKSDELVIKTADIGEIHSKLCISLMTWKDFKRLEGTKSDLKGPEESKRVLMRRERFKESRKVKMVQKGSDGFRRVQVGWEGLRWVQKGAERSRRVQKGLERSRKV